MRLPKSRVLRGTFFGIHDLQNPWSLLHAALPLGSAATIRFRGSMPSEALVIRRDERKAFVRAIVRTVLGKDNGDFGAEPGERGDRNRASARPIPLPRWALFSDRFAAGQYAWSDCPGTVRPRVERLAAEFETAFGENLVGTYVHGSLAMGCFNPRWSDIDLLGVTKEPLDPEEKRSAAEALLRHSAPPRGIEAMFLAERYLREWEYPTSYDFYFSERLRRTYEADLRSGTWRSWSARRDTGSCSSGGGRSYQLAAHLPVIRERGVRLSGRPIAELFVPIPDEDFLDAITRDFESKRRRIQTTAVSGLLNACRNYTFLAEHRFDSKEEAAVRALPVLRRRDRKLVRKALDIYRGHRTQSERFDEIEVAQFFTDMELRLRELRSASGSKSAA